MVLELFVLKFTSGITIKLYDVLYVSRQCNNLVGGGCLNFVGFKHVYESYRYILYWFGTFTGFGYFVIKCFVWI